MHLMFLFELLEKNITASAVVVLYDTLRGGGRGRDRGGGGGGDKRSVSHYFVKPSRDWSFRALVSISHSCVSFTSHTPIHLPLSPRQTHCTVCSTAM